MPRISIECTECGEKCAIVTSSSTTNVQCCPFCGETLLLAPDGDDTEIEVDDDDLHEFDPDSE
jgi:ribosomal protein S27E